MGAEQQAAGLMFGVSPKMVVRWDRGQVLPSAKNYRALRNSGLLDEGSDDRGSEERKRPQAVSPDPVERTTALSGADTSDPFSRAGSFRDDEERLLIAMFGMLSPGQQKAVLKMARAMKPASAEAGTAAEEGQAETDRTERAPAERGK